MACHGWPDATLTVGVGHASVPSGDVSLRGKGLPVQVAYGRRFACGGGVSLSLSDGSGSVSGGPLGACVRASQPGAGWHLALKLLAHLAAAVAGLTYSSVEGSSGRKHRVS